MEKKYRQDSEQANERKNRILYLHSQWLRENGYKNWKKCEQARRKKGGQYLYQLQSKVVRKPPPI